MPIPAGLLQYILEKPPFVSGYDEQQRIDQQRQSANIAQAHGLMQVLNQAQAQREAQRRASMLQQYQAGLRPDMTPEEQVAHAARFTTDPKDVLHYAGQQLEAKNRRQEWLANQEENRRQRIQEIELRGQQEITRVREAEAQRRITKEEADRREATTREMMVRLTASLRPPPQPRQLQLTSDEQGNQLIVNPDGTTTPLTREDGTGVRKAVAADKPMTEFQGKAALYGTRAAQSDKVLKALEDKISVAGLTAGQATGVIGNALMSSEQRRVDQAQRDFVNAVLRQESGAVISDTEFASAKKQYFPQAGDDNNTIAQKRANRQLVIQGFARMSGPKGALDIKAITDEPLLPGVGPNSVTPQQNDAANILNQADAILQRGKRP